MVGYAQENRRTKEKETLKRRALRLSETKFIRQVSGANKKKKPVIKMGDVKARPGKNGRGGPKKDGWYIKLLPWVATNLGRQTPVPEEAPLGTNMRKKVGWGKKGRRVGDEAKAIFSFK